MNKDQAEKRLVEVASVPYMNCTSTTSMPFPLPGCGGCSHQLICAAVHAHRRAPGPLAVDRLAEENERLRRQRHELKARLARIAWRRNGKEPCEGCGQWKDTDDLHLCEDSVYLYDACWDDTQESIDQAAVHGSMPPHRMPRDEC